MAKGKDGAPIGLKTLQKVGSSQQPERLVGALLQGLPNTAQGLPRDGEDGGGRGPKRVLQQLLQERTAAGEDEGVLGKGLEDVKGQQEIQSRL